MSTFYHFTGKALRSFKRIFSKGVFRPDSNVTIECTTKYAHTDDGGEGADEEERGENGWARCLRRAHREQNREQRQLIREVRRAQPQEKRVQQAAALTSRAPGAREVAAASAAATPNA